jgi:threonine synthase
MSQRRRLERLEGDRREALLAALSDEEIADGLALCKRAAGDGIETLSAAEVDAFLRVAVLIDPETPVLVREELAAVRAAAAGEGAVRAKSL